MIPRSTSLRKALLRPAVVTFLILQVISLLVISSYHGVNTLHVGIYLIGSAVGLLFLLALDVLCNRLPKSLHYIVAGILSITLTLIVASNYFLYRSFGEFLTVHMLTFVGGDPHYMLNYIRTYLFGWAGIVTLAVIALFYGIWKPRTIAVQSSWRSWTIRLLLYVTLFLVLLNQVRILSPEHQLPMDGSSLLAIKSYLKFENHPGELCATRHASVNAAASPAQYNIVLIVNESWGKKGLSFYGSPDTAAPFLASWIAREKDNFYTFSNAFTNSSATDVSMPSLLTGVAPYESSVKLHAMPFLWDWARAAGMRSCFVSAQRYHWANFTQFLFSPGPDLHKTAEDIPAPVISDNGVDDLKAVRELTSFITSSASSAKPFFAVYNSNALHAPFQQTSPELARQPAFASRYENAQYILDQTISKIYDALEQSGQLDRTIVIMTADHGDCDEILHQPRIFSFFNEVANIPFLIRLPKSWQASHADLVQNLQANTKRNVMNIDLAPTVAQLTGTAPANDSLYRFFAGSSLLSPVDTDRVCIALNTNDIRHWDHEGFGIYWRNYEFVFSDMDGPRLYNGLLDPAQRADLWRQSPPDVKQKMQSVIESYPFLSTIYKAHLGPARHAALF